MRKKYNNGMSMIEILIGLAIFMILMIPIVNGIIQSLNMSSDAKELQYRNEFSEAVMEHVKSTDIDEITAGKDSSFYQSLGATVSTPVKNSVDIDADYDANGKYNTDTDYDASKVVKLEQTDYTMSGTVNLGTKKKEYSYLVTVDNSYYVSRKKENKDFADPNNMKLGIVEDIDYNKVAVIDGTVWNYDFTASNALLSKKIVKLKENDNAGYQQYISRDIGQTTANQAVTTFTKDTAVRLTTIKIEKGLASVENADGTTSNVNGYTVSCILGYIDSNTSTLESDNYIEYVPWSRTYAGELPNIYLMYNPCVYNNMYSSNDYISIDTSALPSTDIPDVKVFLIETAEKYSTDIVAADNELKDTVNAASGSTDTYKSTVQTYNKDDVTLYYNAGINNSMTRNLVNVHVATTVSGNSNVHLYHNFGNTTTITTALDKLLCTEASDTTDNSDYMDFGSRLGVTYYPLDSGNVLPIDKASEESRGLYEVKVYLKEGSTVPDPDNGDLPILSGTKGGNET